MAMAGHMAIGGNANSMIQNNDNCLKSWNWITTRGRVLSIGWIGCSFETFLESTFSCSICIAAIAMSTLFRRCRLLGSSFGNVWGSGTTAARHCSSMSREDIEQAVEKESTAVGFCFYMHLST